MKQVIKVIVHRHHRLEEKRIKIKGKKEKIIKNRIQKKSIHPTIPKRSNRSSPSPAGSRSNDSNRKETSPLDLIPKRKTFQFSPSQSSPSSNKRSRMQSNIDNNNRNSSNMQPPSKKRKMATNSANNMKDVAFTQKMRRSVSNSNDKRHQSNNNDNNKLKRSPNRKRKRQIHDSSDDEDVSNPLFSKQKQKQQTQNKLEKSPTRSESSISYDFEDDDEDEDEDSLANRYTSSHNKSTNANNDDDATESWLS